MQVHTSIYKPLLVKLEKKTLFKVAPVKMDLYKHIQSITPKTSKAISTKSVAASVHFEENYIKRERIRREETCKEISKMRAELPEYTINDIRMFKLPFHEALMLQLEETGHHNTEAYIREMFRLNDRLREEAGPQSFVWSRPLLKYSDNELKKLSDALVKAEIAHNNENHRLVTEILLKVAIEFAFSYNDWFWLAQELILQCINNALTYGVTGRHQATSRFIYGKILYEKVKDYEKAEVELKETIQLSQGKSWNIKEFLPEEINSSNTLYMNANYLLHFCYIRQAKSFLKSDFKKALECAIMAKKKAAEACYHDGETMALYIKGQCELNLGQTKSAVSTFTKAYYIQSKLKSEKGMCEARVELSKAYLMHGSTNLALKTLLVLKEKAEEFGFQYYLAQAFRYLGEYYLACGEPYKATPLLSDALNMFHVIGCAAESDQVRNLGALSTGLELMPLYIPLIQRTDKRCSDCFENLIKLVKWKDHRQPFWSETKKDMSAIHILEQGVDHLSTKNIDSRYSTLEELTSIIEITTVEDKSTEMTAEEQNEPEHSSLESFEV